MSYEAVCRTAPATPGLLITTGNHAKGQVLPKELEVSPRSGLYLLVVINRPGVAGAVL